MADDYWELRYYEMKAENERLRAALESIAYTDTLPGITLTRVQMMDMVRKALEQ